MPPHDTDAEEAVLGSLLIDRDAMMRVADWLSVDDFYRPKHALIYDAAMALYEKGEPIDIVSIVHKLKARKELADAGGEKYITHLATVVPTAGNVTHYGQIVQKTGTLRRLISAASGITELGFNEDQDLTEVLDLAEQELFSVSQSMRSKNFTKIGDALEDAAIRIDKLQMGDQGLRGVPTGFAPIDHKLAGWQNSDLIILAARPSVGKTTLALDFARYAALAGVPVGMFSLEMSKEQLVDRMLAAHAHVDLWKLRTGQKLNTDGAMNDTDRISEAIQELGEVPLYIDDQASNNVMGIRTMARRLQAEHGLGLLIIDYLQLLESSKYKDNRVQEVSDISRNLKKLAIELNIPIIALSQLSRAVEMRTDQTPKLSDLRESGSIEQDADIVMFLHRIATDEETDEIPETTDTDIIIAKHRNGATGEVSLRLHNKYVTYMLPDNHHEEVPIPAPSPGMVVSQS